MTQIASGNVADRPFARTVFTIARKRFTGDFVLTHRGRTYTTTWHQGFVIAAESPAPGDTVARIALSAGLINSTQLSQALRDLATDKSKSQMDTIVKIANLSQDQVVQIKQQVLAIQSLRMFALETASFVLEDVSSLRAEDDVIPIDPRWLVYHGLATHYSEERLAKELNPKRFGQFRLNPAVEPALSAYGLSREQHQGVLELKEHAKTVEEFAASVPSSDHQRILALIYALAATSALEIVDAPPVQATNSAPQTSNSTVTTTPQHSRPKRPAQSDQKRRASKKAISAANRSPTKQAGPKSTPESTRKLVATKLAQVVADESFFDILGIAKGASSDELQGAYFDLARRLHPDRLRAQQLMDIEKDAHKVFAHINHAYTTLSDPAKRSHYMEVLKAGGEVAYRDKQRNAEELALRILDAESAFQRGLLAVKRNNFSTALEEFTLAVNLNPEEGEHHALWAWSAWCASSDKQAVHEQIANSLETAMRLSPKSVATHYYQGQIAKQTGDVEKALDSFTKVLKLQPSHREAELEKRLLEKRGTSAPPEKNKGFFGRRR